MSKIILPYDIINYINEFLPRPIHKNAKIMKILINEHFDLWTKTQGEWHFFFYAIQRNRHNRRKWNINFNGYYWKYSTKKYPHPNQKKYD